MDPGGFQYFPLLFILCYSCIVPVYVMVLLVDVHSGAIVLVKPPYRLLLLCLSYLECPTVLTYLHLIAVTTKDFIYHTGLFSSGILFFIFTRVCIIVLCGLEIDFKLTDLMFLHTLSILILSQSSNIW